MKTLSLYLSLFAALMGLTCATTSAADEPNEIGPDKEGWDAFKNAVNQFADPARDRLQLLEPFQEFQRHYPKSAQLKRARETCTTLRKMLDEESARRFYPPKAE